MRFQVPQFIETDEPIVGPFSLKQFFWVAGAGAIIFILFLSFGPTVSLILGIPISVMALSMAFVKMEGTPLPKYIYNMISYFLGSKRYTYKSEQGVDLYESKT